MEFAGFRIEVQHTPGHTPGHCCFRTDAFVLSGDLVFAGSIGRSDFPNSSPVDMERSLRRFLELPDELPVWPGHGQETTRGTRTRDEPVPARARLMELAPPRGTQDLLRDRADAMFGLYEAAHRTAELFGFRYVETPMFEHTELFTRTSGETSDVVTKEMYTFEDKGGRSLTLRPESTASVMRAYLTHAQELPNPFKAYYVGSEFRHGRPQAGRLREFRQFGIEVIGVEGAAADVEVVVLGERYLRERGLRRYDLHLNSIGDANCRPAYRERLVDYFEPYRDRLDEDCRTRLSKNPLRVFDCKVDGGKDFVLAAPTIADHLCDACAAHFAAVRGGLDEAGVAYVLDPRLVRGLDYYTRSAFEWVSSALTSDQASTINAGGRYDGLAEALGGQPTPGVGFAMGSGSGPPGDRGGGSADAAGSRAAVLRGGDRRRGGAVAAVSSSRTCATQGISAAGSYEERPLKAQLKMADRAGAAFVAIIGEQELANGTVTLRRLVDGVQKSVPTADRRRVADQARRMGGLRWADMRTAMRTHACGQLRASDAGRRRRALRLGRAPAGPRRRDVHRPARPRGRGAAGVPPGRSSRGA